MLSASASLGLGQGDDQPEALSDRCTARSNFACDLRGRVWLERLALGERRLLNLLITRIRQNHALEHATMHVLERSNPWLRLVGHSDWSGFVLYGKVDTQMLRRAVEEALDRLKAREDDLAVHPHCGTNLVAAALLACGAAYIVGRNSKSPLRRLASVVGAATTALVISRPLGLVLQRHVTTTSDLRGVWIEGVRHQADGPLVVHRVSVRYDREAKDRVLRLSR